jgi:hypothetical protein
MRSSIAIIEPPPLPTEAMDEALPIAQWFALPVAVRVAHRLSEVVILLDAIRDELRIEGDRSLSWIEEEIESAFNHTDAILQRLSF